MVSGRLPSYTNYDPSVPVWCVTPETDGCIHRFFDTSPFSSSGRYLGLTRILYEHRLPSPGDEAEIVVVDLEEGAERTVARTCGWDTQLGAGVQWGTTDAELYYNDLDTETWGPYSIRMDPLTGERFRLDGTVYMISPDGLLSASPSLRQMSLTQAGYGVILPRDQIVGNAGAPDDDGIFLTDTRTGDSRLLVSLREIVESADPGFEKDRSSTGDLYCFHVKWNPQGDRLMLVVRWVPRGEGKMRHDVVTMNAEGKDVRVAVPEAIWGKGGHHPNWCPDGETGLMNVKLDGTNLQFVRFGYDGSGIEPMIESVPGSGHPTLHADGRHVLTDVYLHESLAFGDGTTPIRWIDIDEGTDESIVRINNDPPFPGPKKELRIDPHPAWERSFERICFNGCQNGTRRVYVADLRGLCG